MLSGYRVVLFILLAGSTLAGATLSDPDEDQPLIDRLDKFKENVHNRVIESTGYERLRVIAKTSGETLEFFKFVGYLLLNGTLGTCVNGTSTPTGIKCVIRITFNRSSFGDETVNFLAKDRDENLKDVENFPLLVLPEWEVGHTDAYMSRDYLNKIFSDTWKFFGHMQGRFAETLPADVGWGCYDELPWMCFDFSADVNGRLHDVTMRALTELVGPSCNNLECNSASWSHKDRTQEECETFADEHGFNGGPSNRCLHKFIARYNNYSKEAYKSFIGHVAKYVYWDTIAHGLSLSISWDGKLVDAVEANRRKTWVMKNLANIGAWLLEVDSVFAETPPPYWIVEARRVMENAIGNETVPYPSPSDAVHIYKRIYDRFQSDVRHIAALQIKNLSDSQIDVLVYYPGYDSTEHCYRNMTDVILSGEFSGVNYVVSLRQGHVPSWLTSEDATMERYFMQVNDSQKSDQCERIDDVDRKMENRLSGGMNAVVAVKCARRFVWHELGYQYFPAAYTEAPTVRIEQPTTYNSNCGMLVLFP